MMQIIQEDTLQNPLMHKLPGGGTLYPVASAKEAHTESCSRNSSACIFTAMLLTILTADTGSLQQNFRILLQSTKIPKRPYCLVRSLCLELERSGGRSACHNFLVCGG